jgi:outer membrane lipopolysaccharide assembly protein LptE/RlpB
MLWSDMRTDIARLITYRLQALSNSNVHADASGGHAVTQP